VHVVAVFETSVHLYFYSVLLGKKGVFRLEDGLSDRDYNDQIRNL
jgi:hypothetical protein